MAEWLGRGLQNLVQRFESASDLTGETVKKEYHGSYTFKKKRQKKQNRFTLRSSVFEIRPQH